MTPKKKARKAIKAKIREIIVHGGALTAEARVEKINAALAGWVNCFRVGNSSRAFSEVRDHVEMKINTLLTVKVAGMTATTHNPFGEPPGRTA